MPARKTTAQFITAAQAKHGDRYDYSLVNYISAHRHVQIICKIHGVFPQVAISHIKGSGCPDCGGRKPLDTTTFIAAAQVVYGDRYDYSLVNYSNIKSKVQIICKVHGMFPQIAGSHLAGHGCPDCGGTKIKDTSTFIAEARAKHGDRYDYSLVRYFNDSNKVQIICKIHGPFPQSPSSHVHRKRGCPDCGGTKIKDTSTFIAEARAKHGDRYDYSEMVYVSAHRKVQIICKLHGPFPQQPNSHINGSGCPKCANKLIANSKRRYYRLKAQARFAKYAEVFREMSENQE